MSIFRKRKTEDQCCGHDGTAVGKKNTEQEAGLKIKVLGSGCAKCNALEDAVSEALSRMGAEAEIDHVTDFARIAAFGVMTTPALVVNGEVVSCGKVLNADEVTGYLRKSCF